MITLKNIVKEYNKPVLNDITYTFEPNKIYVIKGVSGCGKTTLLNILGMLENEYEGEYIFDEVRINEASKAEREKIRGSVGYIFQSSLLIANLTIEENLMYINNNKELIKRYAEQLKVSKLLEKYPEQLSGGERQRISIIRSLLSGAKLILADEPTASLDKKNSEEIANLFSVLRAENRTIIVATHEHYFDELADEIIQLDYGVMSEVQKNENVVECLDDTTNDKEKLECKNSWKVMLPLVLRRSKKRLRIFALLPMIFVVTLMLVCFSVQNNFYSETVRHCKEQYPMEVFSLSELTYTSGLCYRNYQYEKYDLYCVNEDNYSCYPLLDEEDSVLGYGGLVKYGKFPKTENEVLISYDMALYLSKKNEADIEKRIGEKIYIRDYEYTITGIVANIEEDKDVDPEIYYGDIYYKNADAVCLVYIPYESIRQYGELMDTSYVMVKVEGIYENEAIYKDVKNNIAGGALSIWDEKLGEMMEMLDFVNEIIWVAFVALGLMGMIFISNDIEVELYYRRRELGYMQIFGISKRMVRLQLMLERMVKNIKATLISIVLFNLVALVLKTAFDINCFVSFGHIMLLVMLILGYSIISLILPIRRFMKKSVLSLITE
ncbi:MAG: ATP-binding cassette domain-containing protein [Lachnospiraceae bacterium]|nr:ATP-binding cassette domain-containing protein [Lachnospiraceae bacterium]